VGRGPRPYKADSRHTWAAGRNKSMSKACAIVVTRTYIGEALLGTLRGPSEPGRGPRAVSLWTPNEASNLSYVPLSMWRTLIVRPWRGRGVEETGGKGPKLYKTDGRHTWAAGRNTSMSKACAIVVNRTYTGKPFWAMTRSWAGSSGCKPLDAERGLESIVRTSQYAEDIDGTPMEDRGGEETGGEGSKAVQSR